MCCLKLYSIKIGIMINKKTVTIHGFKREVSKNNIWGIGND